MSRGQKQVYAFSVVLQNPGGESPHIASKYGAGLFSSRQEAVGWALVECMRENPMHTVVVGSAAMPIDIEYLYREYIAAKEQQ